MVNVIFFEWVYWSIPNYQVLELLHDKMTQCVYEEPIRSFGHDLVPEDWIYVDVLKRGREALEDINKNLGQLLFINISLKGITCVLSVWFFFSGLAFDDWDLDYYTELFQKKLKRNPTSVECFDLAQSNSEHSRHWFFKVFIFFVI